MQSPATYGVPLCLSGIALTLRPSLPQEMADHDRRREMMRRRRERSRHANQEMGIILTNFVNKHEERGDQDDAVLTDLPQGLTAKAA